MDDHREELPDLSEAQREIMQIIWDHGEISAAGVRQILCQRRIVARNTVRTLLERMEAKGWLTHREEGRTHIYAAVRNRHDAMGQKIVEVLDQICGGSPESMMAALIDYRGLDAAELKRIRSMLDVAKARKSRGEEKK